MVVFILIPIQKPVVFIPFFKENRVALIHRGQHCKIDKLLCYTLN